MTIRGTRLASAAARLAVMPRFDVVVAMTTPPLLPALGALYTMLRGGRLVVWLMDLNPDEAVAAGWLREGSLAERVLEGISAWSLRRADEVIVLDRFMRERVLAKGVAAEKIRVIPPWSHAQSVRYDPAGREEFRRRHGLEDKFVVMYSGNHSPCHPLDTLLGAAERLGRHHKGTKSTKKAIVFCFVGGGSEMPKVRRFARERGLDNIVCLPYQPLEGLSASLSAADLHAVVMGDRFVGIVHPCKIYNILAVGIPFLYIGPEVSHITEMMPAGRAWAARHGDVDAVVAAVERVERHHKGTKDTKGEMASGSLAEMVECVGRAGRQAAPPAPQRAARRDGGRLRHEGFDVQPELFSGFVLRQRQVVVGLEIHPILGPGAEEQGLPQGGVGRNGSLAVDDGADAVHGNANSAREAVEADSGILQVFLQDDSRMDRR